MSALDADTDMQGAAERVKGAEGPKGSSEPRKRGRPPGSKTRTNTANTAQAKTEREPYRASAESIAGAALLMATTFKIVGPMVGIDALTEDEATELGKAIDPLLYKYVPMVGEWRDELNALVVFVGVAGVARKRFEDRKRKAKIEAAETSTNGIREAEATVLN